MNARAAALGAVAAVAAAAVTAAPFAQAQPSVRVTDSNILTGARPVSLTYRLTLELQCGKPRVTSLTLTLPQGMTVPARISAKAVLLDGKAAAAVETTGRKLAIRLPEPAGIRCDVISVGPVTLSITKAAGLGNPKQAGAYAFAVTVGTTTVAPTVHIG